MPRRLLETSRCGGCFEKRTRVNVFWVGVYSRDCGKGKYILWSTWRAGCDVSKPGGRLGPRPWSLGVREAARTTCAPQALFGNPRGWCAWIMGEVARRAGPELGVSPRSGREDAPSATEGTVARLRPSIQYRAVAGFPTGFLCFVDTRSVLRRACDFSHLPSEERCSGRGKDARRRKAGDVVSLRVPSPHPRASHETACRFWDVHGRCRVLVRGLWTGQGFSPGRGCRREGREMTREPLRLRVKGKSRFPLPDSAGYAKRRA